MITTDKFVFIHMHKTGGQSLNHIIEQCIPNVRPIGYHYPYHLLPPQYSKLPVVGMVRNPWDWYISWYAFNTRPNVVNPLFFIISDGFQAGYKQTIKNLIRLGSDDSSSQNYRKALIDILPDTLEGNQGVGLVKDDFRELSEPDRGYYSWQFNRMHGDISAESVHIGQFENLQEEFVSIMEKIGVGEAGLIKDKFDQTPRLNSSRHSHYSRYYDDELRDLVTEKEKDLIDRYRYEFEAQESAEKIVTFPSIQIGRKHDSFHKLSGQASNYLLLNSEIDLELIKKKLAKIPQRAWYQSDRENKYEVHKQTQALQLIYDADFRHYKPTYHDLYSEFKKELKPILDFIANHFNHEGFVARAIFTRLDGHGKIDTHTDGLYSLLKCHRIHIPIISNGKVIFTIGGEQKVLREGEMWEINNATLHAVDNQSDESRIHLIIDWVPNSTVRAEDKKPPAIVKKASGATPGYNGRVVGRNEPCPCNSGKKFKRCHGAPS